MTKANEIAYPAFNAKGECFHDSLGLTKREYFAAAALQGLCANYLREGVTGWSVKTYAVEAVELADALIKELNGE